MKASTPASRKALGQWGEALAENYLAGLGFEILAKNVRTPYGELDLVAVKVINWYL